MGVLKRIWQDKNTKKYLESVVEGAVKTNLVYDIETKIVYYKFEGYMSPYISCSGRFCRFIGNEIHEIIITT